MTTTKTYKELEQCKEPREDEIFEYIKKHPGESYYTAREILRNKAYGGTPPNGYGSWGDFWKSY